MNEILKGKKILLGVTGSIAAYKAPMLVREFVKAGAEVKVILTPSAVNFVSPMILSNLSMNQVIIEMFDKSVMDQGAWHIHSAHWCDVMLIAPCSAATLGKIANGIADNALTAVTFALHDDSLLLVSPAMDTNMWVHPATQRNADRIANDGAIIIPPAEGSLSSGLVGPGRFPEFDVILKYVSDALKNKEELLKKKFDANKDNPAYLKYKESSNTARSHNPHSKVEEIKVETSNKDDNYIKVEFIKSEAPRPEIDEIKVNAELDLERMKIDMGIKSIFDNFYKGKKVLINAGPTYEKIDDVRFIGNYSSGKMGYAIANAARQAGAEVVLVSGPVSLPTPEGVNRINAESAGEMHNEVMKYLPDSDVIILSAAVADFTLSNKYDGKIKKEDMGDTFTLQLTKTKDILAEVGKSKTPKQIVVGFALESKNEIENGKKKLQNKNCDMIVVNSANKPDSGFRGDNNTITILDKKGGVAEFKPMSKELCAVEILRKIAEQK